MPDVRNLSIGMASYKESLKMYFSDNLDYYNYNIMLFLVLRKFNNMVVSLNVIIESHSI